MTSRISAPSIPVLGLAAALFATPALAIGQMAPSFVGTWSLNAEKTEPVKDKVVADPSSTGAGGTMATGLQGRGASGRQDDYAGADARRGGGGSGGGRSGGGRATFRLIFGGMVSASKTLKILQADSLVSIEDEDGVVFLNLRADNKVLEEQLTNQTVLKTKVQWRKNELVVERTHDSEGSARMIIRMDEKNPKQLIVDFHYEHKRQRRTIDQRRVYDAGL